MESSSRRRSPDGGEVTAEQIRNRLQSMYQRVAGHPDSDVLSYEAAIEDLRLSLEELRVADEELRQQNDELAAAHFQLDEERKRYQELFSLAPDAYLVTDPGGVIREANLAAIRLLKVEGRFLEGKALATFIVVDDRARFRSLLNGVRRATPKQSAAFQLQPRHGGPISAELTYSPMQEPKRGLVGMRWLIRDVTQRERMGEEIRALNRELESRIAARTADLTESQRLSEQLILREEEARRAAEASEAQSRHVQKLESIGVLAGGIAHDFNNLLHVVLGNADIALSNLGTGSPAREPIEEVIRATLRAADLTRQLLAYSGKGAFVVRHLDLSSEVREMATLLRTGISKQATLTWGLASDLPAVSADPTQIRQVVMNLITNASDALGETGGTITLRTGVTRLTELAEQGFGMPESEDSEMGNEAYVYLEIGDSGSGMSPGTLSRIFDPFFSTKFAGRGLGLAAVMGIVRSHRGLIRIRTAPGEGTTFRVLLPAVAGMAPRIEKPSTERSEWRGSGTILLVEDEEGVREVAQRMLQEIGFETIEAEDGRQALDIIEEVGDSLAAVLLDLSMPRMGGAETLRRLRARHPQLPVLMMSGYTEQAVAPQFEESGPGATAFLQKPFLAEDLIAVLRRFAEAPR
jgi:PAS domain S-box-containing protein